MSSYSFTNLLTGLQISGEVNIGDPDLTNLRIGVRDDWPLMHSALMKAMTAVAPQEMNQIRQKWIAADSEPVAGQTAGPISYGRMILYGLAVFLILSLLAWILIKTIQKENIAVNFGSSWFRGLVLAGLSLFIIIVCLLGWFSLPRLAMVAAVVVAFFAGTLTSQLTARSRRLPMCLLP